MKEKVFSTLFELIMKGSLDKEEAYYLMSLLFTEEKTTFTSTKPLSSPQTSPWTSNPLFHPYCNCPDPVLTDQSQDLTVTTTKDPVYIVTHTTSTNADGYSFSTTSCSDPYRQKIKERQSKRIDESLCQ